MKRREDIIRMIRILVESEEDFQRDYENGRISYKDYLRLRRDIKFQIDPLLWVVGARVCFYENWSIQETLFRAKQWLALLDDANISSSDV